MAVGMAFLRARQASVCEGWLAGWLADPGRWLAPDHRRRATMVHDPAGSTHVDGPMALVTVKDV